jgi:hypothetical protein
VLGWIGILVKGEMTRFHGGSHQFVGRTRSGRIGTLLSRRHPDRYELHDARLAYICPSFQLWTRTSRKKEIKVSTKLEGAKPLPTTTIDRLPNMSASPEPNDNPTQQQQGSDTFDIAEEGSEGDWIDESSEEEADEQVEIDMDDLMAVVQGDHDFDDEDEDDEDYEDDDDEEDSDGMGGEGGPRLSDEALRILAGKCARYRAEACDRLVVEAMLRACCILGRLWAAGLVERGDDARRRDREGSGKRRSDDARFTTHLFDLPSRLLGSLGCIYLRLESTADSHSFIPLAILFCPLSTDPSPS